MTIRSSQSAGHATELAWPRYGGRRPRSHAHPSPSRAGPVLRIARRRTARTRRRRGHGTSAPGRHPRRSREPGAHAAPRRHLLAELVQALQGRDSTRDRPARRWCSRCARWSPSALGRISGEAIAAGVTMQRMRKAAAADQVEVAAGVLPARSMAERHKSVPAATSPTAKRLAVPTGSRISQPSAARSAASVISPTRGVVTANAPMTGSRQQASGRERPTRRRGLMGRPRHRSSVSVLSGRARRSRADHESRSRRPFRRCGRRRPPPGQPPRSSGLDRRRSGFVEQQGVGPVHERGGHHQPPLLSTRQVIGARLSDRRESEEVEQTGGTLAGSRTVTPAGAGRDQHLVANGAGHDAVLRRLGDPGDPGGEVARAPAVRLYDLAGWRSSAAASTVPVVGRRRPASTEMRLDLPAPLGPVTASARPADSRASTSDKARTAR